MSLRRPGLKSHSYFRRTVSDNRASCQPEVYPKGRSERIPHTGNANLAIRKFFRGMHWGIKVLIASLIPLVYRVNDEHQADT